MKSRGNISFMPYINFFSIRTFPALSNERSFLALTKRITDNFYLKSSAPCNID